MRILQLVSCRGWSSDAYWAARVSIELARRGHQVMLGLRAGTESRVIRRARDEGATEITTFGFAGGVRPGTDVADVRRIAALLGEVDVVHVHRGKEHWLAAVANRITRSPRPIVRTRHIVQAVRAHRGNRWLYGSATALVTAVTDAIRRQYVASGLVAPDRIVTISGGADAERYRPGPADPEVRRHLTGEIGVPLVGMVGGLRIMKGHALVVDAVPRLARAGLPLRVVFVGQGSREAIVRDAIRRAGLDDVITVAGFASDLPAVMRALDVGLYVPLESEGMSRVVFEYLAAATPLIASRVGVVPEVLVDGEHAVLVPAGDASALADALARLLGDADLRGRLARAGHRLVGARYSGARVAETLEGHYRRLTEPVNESSDREAPRLCRVRPHPTGASAHPPGGAPSAGGLGGPR
ncbi:MAG: glycosyltransferase [Candidatus Rokubacteria bacterium]|nr:glycosyltransferase [Candidatus Rokubacteria bacterium]